MSRVSARAEDVITVAAALALFLFLGAKSIGRIRLTEQNYWDFAFILLPVAVLVLAASIRYAFRPAGAPAIREVTAETGSILRDWSPFLVFLMLYESFRVTTWAVVWPADKDPMLLRWDRTLFGETPSVALEAWIRPWLTEVMAIAERENAIPYDVKDVELGHHGKECSFDAVLKKYELDRDPAMVLLAKIVNGADTDNALWNQPEAAGLNAVAEGFRHLGFKDDHAINAAQWIVYDAMYAYCQEMIRRGKPDGLFR